MGAPSGGGELLIGRQPPERIPPLSPAGEGREGGDVGRDAGSAAPDLDSGTAPVRMDRRRALKEEGRGERVGQDEGGETLTPV